MLNTLITKHVLLQDKRRLVKQVDSLELALQIKADEVAELKGKLEAEVRGRVEHQHHHEQVGEHIYIHVLFVDYFQYWYRKIPYISPSEYKPPKFKAYSTLKKHNAKQSRLKD